MTKPTKGSNATKAIMTGAAIISLSAGIADNAIAASGSGTIQAILLTPIVVTGTQSLNFGSFTVNPTGTGGEVVVAPDGTRSTTAGAAVLNLVTGLGAERADVVSLSGATGTAIDLIIPAGVTSDGPRNGVSVTNGYAIANTATPTQTMAVGNFVFGTPTANLVVTATATPADLDVTLAVSPGIINLGGTVLVKNTNTAGSYTGTYDITANYQ
jgi:hypothetical protein